MEKALDLVDTTTTGGPYDVTPLFGNYHAFSALLDDLPELCREIEYGTVVGIGALGFVVGSASAVRAARPSVPTRKGGKLPVEVHKASFIDYTGKEKSLEIRPDALTSRSRVLLVDEWIETAAQVKAAIGLVEGLDAEVSTVHSIAIDDSPAISELGDRYAILAISQDSEQKASWLKSRCF